MVIVTTHIWVKHVITKVEVLTDDQGYPVIFVDPAQQLLAEEDAAYGCQVCGYPMSGNLDTECKGQEDE